MISFSEVHSVHSVVNIYVKLPNLYIYQNNEEVRKLRIDDIEIAEIFANCDYCFQEHCSLNEDICELRHSEGTCPIR
jgi:hypothetical protein